MTAGQHRHGAAFDAGAMRRLVDAARQSRGNDETGLAKIPRQRACEFQAGAGGVARADDRDHRPHQHLKRAAHAEQRRRIVEHCEPRRIAGFARRHQSDAVSFARCKLSARIFLAADPARPRRAAAPRQIGQPLQRRPRAAEMIDE